MLYIHVHTSHQHIIHKVCGSGRSSDRGRWSLAESGTSASESGQTGCEWEIPADCLQTTASDSEKTDYDWCEEGLTA